MVYKPNLQKCPLCFIYGLGTAIGHITPVLNMNGSYLVLHSRTNSKRDYCCGRKLNVRCAKSEKLFADSSTLPLIQCRYEVFTTSHSYNVRNKKY